MRKIIHIDMDAFFASVEQRDDPSLKGLAIAVGGSPSGRGVVMTASYEARKFGVKSAMSSMTAQRLCPNLIFVRPRMEAYKLASQQIRDIFYRHTDLVEPLSLDEAYLDVTENKSGNPSAPEKSKQASCLKPGSQPRRAFHSTSSWPKWRADTTNPMASITSLQKSPKRSSTRCLFTNSTGLEKKQRRK